MNKESISREEVIEMCGFINIAVKQQYDLIEGLLLWARSNTGRLTVDKAYFPLFEAIEKTKEILLQSIIEKKLVFVNNIPEELVVFADMNLTLTILRNLLSNAIKFTPDNGRIIVSATKNDGFFEISINDTGIGIKKDDIDKLFKIEEVFSTPGTKEEKGTGLGLIICHEFAEKQDGDILVDSTPGKGTTFTLRLPVEVTDD